MDDEYVKKRLTKEVWKACVSDQDELKPIYEDIYILEHTEIANDTDNTEVNADNISKNITGVMPMIEVNDFGVSILNIYRKNTYTKDPMWIFDGHIDVVLEKGNHEKFTYLDLKYALKKLLEAKEKQKNLYEKQISRLYFVAPKILKALKDIYEKCDEDEKVAMVRLLEMFEFGYNSSRGLE